MMKTLFATLVLVFQFAGSAYTQDTTLIFTNGMSLLLRKETVSGKTVYRTDRNGIEKIETYINYVDSEARRLKERIDFLKEDISLANSKCGLKDSINIQSQRTIQQYKGVIDELNSVIESHRTILNNCKADLSSCNSDLGKAQNRTKLEKVWTSMKGVTWGLAAGLILGFALQNNL